MFIKTAAEVMKSLGHPVRLEMVILLKNNPKRKMTVSDIQHELNLTQPETSRHLILLKHSSVLKLQKEGSTSYYYINDELSFIECIAKCLNKHQE